MIRSEQEFLSFLDANGFKYQRIKHPAVFTCAEAELHRPAVPAVSTKNLFLCDKKARRFFLAVTACEKTVKLDALAKQLGVANLRFASEANLLRLLGVTRGAVTMMGLANDTEHAVELWIDAGIWQGEMFLSHPLVNTATLILKKFELERFFALTGHTLHLFTGE
ncbi:MAG: aminoacyl-tRNA deacylase [Anaerolineales bacterium]|nr:prolyl-tRNA synthetase associated domain-containing protein [Anaerolineae bacterium]PWB74391.1 MAG: aminoacyl-tRNA deacylase [Anaerolineales bacterium]